MEFINHTPFPALAFEGIEPNDQAFHVVVLRQTLSWEENGILDYHSTQYPLCEEDEFFGAINVSGVRQESDLCHFKPRCDVIVNAHAHAPGGKAVRRLAVAMRLFSADGHCLINKQLMVTGERSFVETSGGQLVSSAIQMATLGLVRSNSWQLTEPEPFVELPLRAEYSFGGGCRIDSHDVAARKIGREFTLSEKKRAQHPDGQDNAPVAHQVDERNPLGVGFSTSWYLSAKALTEVKAPRIETAAASITAGIFWDAVHKNGAWPEPASLGIRFKGHPERRKLAGTIDDAFINSERWLPIDFDFSIWNAAQEDQQIEFLRGGEIIELENLCTFTTPGAQRGNDGVVRLKLTLPTHECSLLLRHEKGHIFSAIMQIDTLIIEPELQQVSIVWRAAFDKAASNPLRKIEVYSHPVNERPHLEIDTEFNHA